MKNIYVFTITLFILLSAISIADDGFEGWYKATSEEANYEIMFPGSAVYSIYPKMESEEIKGSLYAHEMAKLPFGIYIAIQCIDFSDDATTESRIKKVINLYKDDYTDTTFVFKDSVSNSQFKRKGVEYSGVRIIPSQIKKKDIYGYLRIYSMENKVYTFEVVGDTDLMESDLPEKFYNSFKLLNKD